jgi:hypothetical protein
MTMSEICTRMPLALTVLFLSQHGCAQVDDETAEKCCEALKAMSPVPHVDKGTALSPSEAVAIATESCDLLDFSPPDTPLDNAAAWQLSFLALYPERWQRVFLTTYGPGDGTMGNLHADAVETLRQRVLRYPDQDNLGVDAFVDGAVTGPIDDRPEWPLWFEQLTPNSDSRWVLEHIGHKLEPNVLYHTTYGPPGRTCQRTADCTSPQVCLADRHCHKSIRVYDDAPGDEGAIFAAAIAYELEDLELCDDDTVDNYIVMMKDPTKPDWENELYRWGFDWLGDAVDWVGDRLEDIGDWIVGAVNWIYDHWECIAAYMGAGSACALCAGTVIAGLPEDTPAVPPLTAACGRVCASAFITASIACAKAEHDDPPPGGGGGDPPGGYRQN